MRCQWCSNPESQKSRPEIGFIDSICVGADRCRAPCVPACPEDAVRLDEHGKPVIDRRSCKSHGRCADACFHGALKLVGREMSVDQVLAEVEKDRPFYRRSGGGITVGGGEPLAQSRFTAALLEAAQGRYLHTAIETSGHAPWRYFEDVLEYVDQLHFDVKHMDPERHKDLTGQSNELILDNLKKVSSIRDPQDVIVRIPIIPGCNDSFENISESARFVAELGLTQIELIPYHRFGVSKYGQYGMVYRLDESRSAPEMDLHGYRDIVESYGLREITGRP